MNAMARFLAIGYLLCFLSCEPNETFIVVEVVQNPDAVGVTKLRVSARLNSQADMGSRDFIVQEFTQYLDRISLELPKGTMGQIQVTLKGFDKTGCLVSSRVSDVIEITGPGRYDLTISLAKAVEAQTCLVTVCMAGNGSGSIIFEDSGIRCPAQCVCGTNPTEINCSGLCSHEYPKSMLKVTLRAVPNVKSYFAGWSDPCPDPVTCNVSANPGSKITAAFAQKVCDDSGWCWEYPLPLLTSNYGVFALTNNNVWVVGLRGTILHWDGFVWSDRNINTAMPGQNLPDLRGVWSYGQDVWAVGAAGKILRALDVMGVFKEYPSGDNTGSALNAIWGSDPNHIWAVGDAGTILYWNGGPNWIPQDSNTRKNLSGVWGSNNNVWAVGDMGTILRWDGNDWKTLVQTSNTIENLSGVWGSDPNNIWAVGNMGTILNSNVYAKELDLMPALPSASADI